MSKKKLTKQQKSRIIQKQKTFDMQNALQGLVITRGKKQALIESFDEHHREILCTIRADIGSLVVGDIVYWQATAEDQGVVERVLPRHSELGRPDRYQKYKVLAANITQVIIVVAPKPLFSELLIDSYLVMAELMGLKASIIFNKTDLDDAGYETKLRAAYEHLVHAFLSHSQQKTNADDLEHLLRNEVNIFVGQSGVGKSTMINQLIPHQALATSPLSAIHEFGQHTTSNAYYFHLPNSGAIIDSPGVRSFGLWKVTKPDLLWGFKEFRPFIGKCKFRDCDHVSSPSCALMEAIKNLKVSEIRYQNYIKLRSQFNI